MLFHVDPSNGVPIFRQLMDQVKLSIATGALKTGDELPSIRNLSVPLGVNPMTISKAYNLLVHDGVLERRPGLPLIVAPFANRRVTLSFRKIVVVRYSPAGNNTTPPPAAAAASIALWILAAFSTTPSALAP